ncbi:unnamed protein product [Schistosoma rodhaini]|uniref:Ima1 N-terminal domain-containing protein n=1 Tax=Schistosoma rodhaini TaxID=6188 RepID=A0AA85FZY1_9TREM|nr:unnamed protein product [Schistosoma rodhaini]
MLVLALCLGLFSAFTVFIVRFFYLKVQCWFCGHTASTSWSRKTSFVCQQCGQYNGFTSDGDYNKVIPSQFSAELNPVNFSKARGTFSSHSDVLCPDCTRNQNTIVQKLSEYTPKNDRSDEEIKEYTRLLELEYGLCSSCYRKVNDKLRQLDYKLLPSFIDWWHNNKQQTISITKKSSVSLKTPRQIIIWFELFIILRLISILCFICIIISPILIEISKQTCLIYVTKNKSYLYKLIELFWSSNCRFYTRQYCNEILAYSQHFSLTNTGQLWFNLLLICLQITLVAMSSLRLGNKHNTSYHYSIYHDGLKTLVVLYDISMLLISLNILLSSSSSLIIDSFNLMSSIKLPITSTHITLLGVFILFASFIIILYGIRIWLSFFLKDCKSQQKTLKDTWPSNVKLPCLQSTDSISYYSTPSHHSTNYTMNSFNSSGRSLEDELADTKLFSTTNKYNNVFRPSVLSGSNISPSAIGSRHSYTSSNMYSTHYNPMKQQMIESGQRDDDNLSYLSSVSHYKPNCYTLDSNSSGQLPTNLTQFMVKRKSNSSKRKRRTGLIHFVLCLLFGRLETWKDVCLELTCLANAIFLSIVIYCTYRLMYCLVNVFDA